MPASVTIVDRGSDTPLAYRARYAGEQFEMVMKVQHANGDPFDVSSADLSLHLADGDRTIEKAPDDFTNPHDGISSQCSVPMTADDTAEAGRYRGQLTIEEGSSITKSNQMTLVVMSGESPLTLADIRLSLMDTPELNEYLQERELSDDVLAMARQRALDQWNSRAGSHTHYTVDSFPAKSHSLEKWRRGAMAQALKMQVTGLLRNRVQMKAEGVAADERGPRAKAYQKLADQWEQEWKVFIAKQQWAHAYENAWRTI